MTSGPLVKGWCPGALRPMLSGDGLVVRIKPPGGRVSTSQALEISALASRHGSGVLEISNRANLQLRGVRAEAHGPLIDRLKHFDLVDSDPDVEARRSILVAPFWEDSDPTQSLARDLAYVLAQKDAPWLPGKFGFAVDCGATPVLQTARADIRIERTACGALICAAEGARAGALVTSETAVEVALDLSRWFLGTGGAASGRGRMAAHIARGVPLPARFRQAARMEPNERMPTPGPVAQGYLIGFPFGQIQAETLAALATCGALRLTPWRMVLVEGLRETPKLDGLITRAGDPLSRVVACPGAPFCPQAYQPTRPLARALAPHVSEGNLLHISGCAKGCAHSRPATRTLVAGPSGFSVIRDGRASDAPASAPISADALAQRPSLVMKDA